MRRSDRPDTLRLDVRGEVRTLPVARFDNRHDRTSFVRADRSAWKPEDVRALHAGLSEAFGRLARAVRVNAGGPASSR